MHREGVSIDPAYRGEHRRRSHPGERDASPRTLIEPPPRVFHVAIARPAKPPLLHVLGVGKTVVAPLSSGLLFVDDPKRDMHAWHLVRGNLQMLQLVVEEDVRL